MKEWGFSLAGFVVSSPKLICSGESKMTLVSDRGEWLDRPEDVTCYTSSPPDRSL